MSSLRSITDDLKRPLAENEVWTLLNLSLKSLSASYRDFKPSHHLNKSSIGPFLIISVDGLLLCKNTVQFNSGLQSEAAPDVAAPELLKEDGGINSLEALQKTHIFSLGAVLRLVMSTDSISYSQKLTDALHSMIQLDPTCRPSLQDIIQIAQEGLDNHQSDVSSLFDTINDMWEGSSNGEPNLAAEIAEIEPTHSGGSSLSINSHESTDGMNRPSSIGSYKRPISWSSQERLKIKDQEKSQFYTPVRNRRKEDDGTLPPLPPSISRKRTHKTPGLDGGDIPALPPPIVAPGSPLKIPPPKPPRIDLILTSTPNVPGKRPLLDSVKMIENILESNSAPDLLSKDLSTRRDSSSTPPPHYKKPVDLFADTTDDGNDDPAPPPLPTASPPTMSPPKPPSSSAVSSVNYQKSLHESKDKSQDMIMPPVSVPPDSTFEYTSSLNVTQSLNEESVSTNEFTLDHIDSEMAQKLTLDDDSQNKEEDSNEAPPPVPPKRTRRVKTGPSTVTDTTPVKDEVVNPPIIPVDQDEDPMLPSTNEQRLLLTSMDDEPEGSPGPISEGTPLLSAGPHHSYVLPSETYPGSIQDMMSYGQIEVIEPSLSPSFSDITNAQDSRSKINKVLGKDETPQSSLRRRNSQKFYLESHVVKIEALGMTSTHLRIKANATGQELLTEAAKKFCIADQAETLGIAVDIDEEYIFLEPDKKIHKYAPSGWKKWKPGCGRNMPRFTVHLRVMYFPLNISMLSMRESRHLHYEQTFHDIVNGCVHVTKDEAILLAGLALQAQFGDYRGQVNYFKPIHYIPKNVLREMKNQNVHDTLRAIHEQRKGLTRQKAEHQYLREAAKLADYGYIYYRVSLTKDWVDDCAFLLGFSTKGLRLCHDETDGTRTIDLQCPWKTTTKIAFKDNILLLEVVGQDPIQVYADDYKRARYYVRLSQMYHFFDRSYRDCSYPTPLDVRDVIIHNVLDYRGSFIAVKIVKHGTKGLGITLTGHSGKSQKFAEIKVVKKDTPAAVEGTLQAGDLLVEANRRTLINKSHKEVGEILSELPPLIELKIFRRANFRIEDSLLLNVTVERADNRELSFSNFEMATLHSTMNDLGGIRESSFIEPEPLPCSLSVKVKRQSTGSAFGFSIEHKDDLFHISKIAPGGAAERTGQISIGDQLLSVNGDNVDGKSKQDVFKILKEFPGEELEIEIASSKVPETMRTEGDTDGVRTEEGTEVTQGEDTDGDGSVIDAAFQRKGTLVTDSRILDESGAARSLSLSSDKLQTVRMTKKNDSFGFAIKRSSKNPYAAVQVSKITPGGAADETGSVSLGDQIVSVNGVCVDGKGYREVFDLLYKAGAAHEMELELCPQDDGSHVTITLDKSKPLGLRIKEDMNGSIVVSSVIEGSQAQKTGQVHKGDELVEVNGTTLHGLSMREATELLLRSDSPLYIYIKKSPVNMFHMVSQIKEDQSELKSESKSTDDYDDKYIHFTVTLTKGTRGFGFKIRKGLSDERDERGLFIASIDYDPALSDGQLRSGDEIIEFNGDNLIGIPNSRGVAKMKSATDTGVMVIRRRKDIQPSIHESQNTEAIASTLLTQEVSAEDENATNNSIELKTLTKEIEENQEQKEEESTTNDVEETSKPSSAKDRKSKGRSASLPMIVSKQSESSPTSSPRVKPKLAPKPASVYKSNENMTKPTIPPNPKILPKPAVAKKPPVIPVTSPEPSLFKSTENSDSISPVRQSSSPENTSTVIPTDDVKRNLEESSDSTPILIVNSSEKDFSSSGEQQVISTSPPGPLPPVFISDDDDTLMHVQSAATSTTIDEVVGANTKRGAVDSCYQEGMEEIREKWNTAKRNKAREKRKQIALELLETEKTYVSRIKIIAEDFRQAIQSINIKSPRPVVSDDTINIIFLNIGEIYNLNKQLLDDIENRMNNWAENEQICDVISSIAPFLKLYSIYTAGFEDAMKKLTVTMAKEKKLDVVVKEFERNLGTGLGVAHYMLEPIQRIPRYKLLLEAYLKNLPDDSEERSSATKALEIIGEAADRTNNRIKELENSNEILAIERTITDYEGTLLLAHRRFIKKGILQKSSRKAKTPRMFFLFSDILLHTEPTGPSTYKFKNEMTLCSVKVEIPKVSLVPFSFELFSTNRSFILSARSEEEMMEWMTILLGTIRDNKEKMKSLKRGEQLLTLDRSGFGSSAPILVPDQSVSMCQICSKEFTFTFRRHHCRACGRVVCGICSPFKTYLAYMNKEERICSLCNHHQKKQHSSQGGGDEVDGDVQPPVDISHPNIPSVLILDHENEAIIRGYVLEQDGKKWNRCWYAVGKDLALYKFKAHEDIRATETVTLPGYRVTTDRASMTINLIHHQAKKNLNLSFRTENVADFEMWVEVVEKAAQMVVCEVPVNQDNRMSVSYGSRNRVHSKSLQDIVYSDESVPVPLTPPST